MWLRGVFRTISKAVNCFRKKVAGPQSCNFTEKETSTQLVSSEIWQAIVTTCSKIFQLCLLRTTNPWSPATLTMTNEFENAFTYQDDVPSKIYWSIFSYLYFFRLQLFPLYQTTNVFLAFTKRIIYYFHNKCAIQ